MTATDQFVYVLLGELQDLRDLGDRSKSVWRSHRLLAGSRSGQQDDLKICGQTGGLACALRQRRDGQPVGERWIAIKFVEADDRICFAACSPGRSHGTSVSRQNAIPCWVRRHTVAHRQSD
jgi:hypothetical protein